MALLLSTKVILSPEEKDEHRDIVARGCFTASSMRSPLLQTIHWTNLDMRLMVRRVLLSSSLLAKLVGLLVAPADKPRTLLPPILTAHLLAQVLYVYCSRRLWRNL